MVLGLLTPAVLGSFFESSAGQRVSAQIEQLGDKFLDAKGRVSDAVFDSWSKDDLEAWLKSHEIDFEDSLEAAKENKDLLLADISGKADSVGDSVGDAGQKILSKGKEYYESLAENVVELWNDNKLLEYIHERGIKEPAEYTHDQLVKLAQSAKDKLPEMPDGHFSRNWFSGWSRDDLAAALKSTGQSIEGSRKELVDRVYAVYTDAFAKGQDAGNKAQKSAESVGKKAQKSAEAVGSDLQSSFMHWKEATFDKWSLEDLKEYCSDFSDEVGTKRDELIAQAKANYNQVAKDLRPKIQNLRKQRPPRPHACKQIADQVNTYWAKASPYVYSVYSHLRQVYLQIYAFVRSKF